MLLPLTWQEVARRQEKARRPRSGGKEPPPCSLPLPHTLLAGPTVLHTPHTPSALPPPLRTCMNSTLALHALPHTPHSPHSPPPPHTALTPRSPPPHTPLALAPPTTRAHSPPITPHTTVLHTLALHALLRAPSPTQPPTLTNNKQKKCTNLLLQPLLVDRVGSELSWMDVCNITTLAILVMYPCY